MAQSDRTDVGGPRIDSPRFQKNVEKFVIDNDVTSGKKSARRKRPPGAKSLQTGKVYKVIPLSPGKAIYTTSKSSKRALRTALKTVEYANDVVEHAND